MEKISGILFRFMRYKDQSKEQYIQPGKGEKFKHPVKREVHSTEQINDK